MEFVNGGLKAALTNPRQDVIMLRVPSPLTIFNDHTTQRITLPN